MASPKTASFVQLHQLSLAEKLHYIESAKAESEMLQHRIASIRREVRNTSLSQVSHSVPALTNLKLSKPNLYKGHRGKINDMKLAHSSQTLVTVGQDGFAIIWDAITGSKMDFVQLANCWALSCAISPLGRLIATGGLDNACTVYTVKNSFEDTSSVLETDNLISNSSDNGIGRKNEGANHYQMFALGPNAPVCLLKGHKAYISGMAFPLENKLLSSSGDMSINYWDLNRNERIFEFSDRNLGDVSSVAVHPSNPNVFVSGSLKTVKVWDVRVPISTQEFFGHEDDVNVVSMFPDGYSVLSGSDDKTCRLFDMRSDCQLNVYSDINRVNSPVTKVEFSPSGRLFFASYEDGTLSAWDVLKGTWMGELTKSNGPSCMITSVQASANGSRLYTSSWDGMIRGYRTF